MQVLRQSLLVVCTKAVCGLGLALCCDIRIANDVSTYAVPAAKLGLGYRADGLKRLVDVVGPSFAGCSKPRLVVVCTAWL